MLAALIIAVSILPVPDVLRESVSCIDDNFFYDGDGKLVFEQIIFLDFNERTGEESIVAWRLAKEPSQKPQRDHTGGYFVMWNDNGQLRRVHSQSLRETHYQFDIEVEAREKHPKESRRELRSPKGYR
jgi:hypothetical protein